MASSFDAYIEKQNSIYDNMANVHDRLGIDEGIERDPGTEPQAAFLVAWRHPEHITEQVEDLSLAVGGLYNAITYGRKNAHTTLSDIGLTPNLLITPDNPDHAATLSMLTTAVRNGLDKSRASIAERGVSFDGPISNKKTVMVTGQPTEANWQISEAVKAASAELGLNDGAGLKGSWGNHMTINRFLADYPPESATNLRTMLDQAAPLGDSKPTAIDVGYFHTDPTNGFVYTTHDSFDLKHK